MDLTPLITELNSKADLLDPVRKVYETFKPLCINLNETPEPDFTSIGAVVIEMQTALDRLSEPRQRALMPLFTGFRLAKTYIDPNEEFFFI